MRAGSPAPRACAAAWCRRRRREIAAVGILQGEEDVAGRLRRREGDGAPEGLFRVGAQPQIEVGAAEGQLRRRVPGPLGEHAQLAAHCPDAGQVRRHRPARRARAARSSARQRWASARRRPARWADSREAGHGSAADAGTGGAGAGGTAASTAGVGTGSLDSTAGAGSAVGAVATGIGGGVARGPAWRSRSTHAPARRNTAGWDMAAPPGPRLRGPAINSAGSSIIARISIVETRAVLAHKVQGR